MDAGRKILKEFYVGFLLLLVTFLYLSRFIPHVKDLENKSREIKAVKHIVSEYQIDNS
jgi:hypothetical protein